MIESPIRAAMRSPLQSAMDRIGSEWTPAALFAASEQGVWCDPSDFRTMFQNSNGATPVTAVGQPVGSLLDKRIDSAYRPTTGIVWTKTQGDGVLTVSGNTVTVTGATTTTFIKRSAGDIPLAAGLARMVILADYSGATEVKSWLRGSPTALSNGITSTLTNQLNNSDLERLDVGTGTVVFTVTSLEYWRGNHARQATAAARPVSATGIDLDGVDDSMAQSGGGGSTTAFMLCAAVKPEGGAASARTIWSDAGTDTGYIVRLNASNQLEFAASNNSPIATPVQAAATTATTGGTGLAAQTAYYYVVTALNALGETLKSDEQTVTTGVGTTNSNTISWGAITGATGYRIYRGTAAGAENVYYAVGEVTSYVDTGAASTDGSPPAYGSTAYVKVATTGTLDVGTQNVVTVWDDGVNLNAQINNGAVASVARPATVPAGSTTATIGKNNLAAIEFFNGLIYSLVQVKDDGGTDAERTAAKAYAAGKGGVTL